MGVTTYPYEILNGMFRFFSFLTKWPVFGKIISIEEHVIYMVCCSRVIGF